MKRLSLVPVLMAAVALGLPGCSEEAEKETEATAAETTQVDGATATTSETEDTGASEATTAAAETTDSDADADTAAADPAGTVEMKSAGAGATPGKLTIGDEAPAIHVAAWVKGEPVASLAGDKVHVVEFWATWCGPCKTSMPHMSQLQEQYKDSVQFVGVSDEKEEVVKAFMDIDSHLAATWNEVIKYTIAVDDNNQTTQAYMRAAGENGIPTAFIVGRDGKVDWIGHPMEMDEPLAAIVAGTYDREAAVAERKNRAEMQEVLMAASRKLQRATSSGDWDAAVEVLDGLIEKYPGDARFTQTKLQILREAGRNKQLAEAAAPIAEAEWENAQALNGIAWMIAGESKGDDRDLELALRVAKRAVELAPEDGSILDTLARVHYEMGDLEAALTWQRKAVEHAEPGVAGELEAALKKYQAEAKPADETPADKEDTADAGDTQDEDAGDKEGDKEEQSDAGDAGETDK